MIPSGFDIYFAIIGLTANAEEEGEVAVADSALRLLSEAAGQEEATGGTGGLRAAKLTRTLKLVKIMR